MATVTTYPMARLQDEARRALRGYAKREGYSRVRLTGVELHIRRGEYGDTPYVVAYGIAPDGRKLESNILI